MSRSSRSKKTPKELEDEDRKVELVLRATMKSEEYAFEPAVIEEKLPQLLTVKRLVLDKYPGCVRACVCVCSRRDPASCECVAL